jgi:hypothetical protein
MKTRFFAWFACCAAVPLMTAPLMARAATKILTLADAEPQYASGLCWAAAEVLTVNQFYPQCLPTTGTPPATPARFRTSQAVEAGYHEWHYSTASPPLSTLGWYLSHCEDDIQNCDDWDSPQLYGLTFKWGKDFNDSNGSPDPQGLNWEAMTQEIDHGRPVLFKWAYSLDGTGTTPVAKHQLVVIGYSDEGGTQQLQIWDPLPVPDALPSQVPACGPAGSVVVTPDHSRTILFSTYRVPVNDMGLAVTAMHDYDQWNIAVIAPDAPQLTVESLTLPLPPSPPPLQRSQPEMRFAKALELARAEARLLDLQVPGAAPRSLGLPFPIVGLGFQQLLGSLSDPTSLLKGTTSAVLFPVESHGEVVDAFLMLFSDRRWRRGGYANIGVTKRLVKVREEYAKLKHIPIESIYVVSVPGEAAFFAAHGRDTQTILIPASSDPKIDAVAGQAVPAAKQLRKLTQVILIDLKRYQARSLPAPRPVP